MKTPHSSCRRGKKVRLILRDGTVIVSKFVENKGHDVVLESGVYGMGEIRAFSIYKPLQHELHKNQ